MVLRLVLFLAIAQVALCLLPGFKSSLTQNGVSYAKDIGVQLLERELSKITIPDQSGDVSPGISWWLTNMNLGGVALSQSSATLVPGVGLNLMLGGLSATLNFDWRYRQDGWPHISDSGNGDVSISDSSAQCEIHFYDNNGRPAVQVVSTNVNLNNFNVHVNGGPSWLYNFLIGIFEGKIKDAVTGALTNGITNGVNSGLNQLLQGLPISVAISPTVEIDYELVDQIGFTSTSFTLPEMGEFYQIGNHQEAPPPRYPIPDVVSGNMVQLILSDFVPLSAGFVYWKLGQLVLQIDSTNLPSWSPVKLNTTDWKYLLPNLYKQYPDQAMVIQLQAVNAPTGVFAAGGAKVAVYGWITVSVVNTTLLPAFTLNGTVSAAGSAALQGQTIIPSLSDASVDFSLYSSNIGNFDVTVLNQLVNILFQKGIIPTVNGLLAKGFPLPMVPGVTFVNPTVSWGDHYLAVATDITYTLPPAFLMATDPPKEEEASLGL